MPGCHREKRLYHINMMSKWYPGVQSEPPTALLTVQSASEHQAVSTLVIPEMVPESCKERLLQLLSNFPDLFGDNPGRITLVEHTIEVQWDAKCKAPSRNSKEYCCIHLF